MSIYLQASLRCWRTIARCLCGCVCDLAASDSLLEGPGARADTGAEGDIAGLWEYFPWEENRPEDEVFSDLVARIEQDGIHAIAHFPDLSTTWFVRIDFVLCERTRPLLTPLGQERARASGMQYHLTLSRTAFMDESLRDDWHALATAFDGVQDYLPVGYVSDNAVAYIDYNVPCPLLDHEGLWRIYWAGPYWNAVPRRYLHVSM